MEINGTIMKILPVEEVTFNDGTKKMKGGFVIMREGEFPKPVAFELFGEDRIDMLTNIAVGTPVKVSFYADSHEGKNGNYYTTLKCLSIATFVQQNPYNTTMAAVQYPQVVPPAEANHSASTPSIQGTTGLPTDDDLPPF